MGDYRTARFEVNKWVALLVGLIAVISSTIAAYDRVVMEMYNDRIARTELMLAKHETSIHEIEKSMSTQMQMLIDIRDDLKDIKQGLK